MKFTYGKRAYTVFLCFIILFAGLSARIYTIQKNIHSNTADMQFSREITLGETRGNIYDINMRPLVNELSEEQYIVMSDKSTEKLIGGDKLKEIKKGLFVKLESDKPIEESKFIRSYNTITRYSDNLLCILLS